MTNSLSAFVPQPSRGSTMIGRYIPCMMCIVKVDRVRHVGFVDDVHANPIALPNVYHRTRYGAAECPSVILHAVRDLDHGVLDRNAVFLYPGIGRVGQARVVHGCGGGYYLVEINILYLVRANGIVGEPQYTRGEDTSYGQRCKNLCACHDLLRMTRDMLLSRVRLAPHVASGS